MIAAIEAREQAGGLGAALLRLNYLHLDRDQAPRPVEYRLRYQAQGSRLIPLMKNDSR